MKPLAPNTLLQNRYLVVHLIGKGGMGEVYLAVDQRLGSAMALKRTYFTDDEMYANAFEREARTLARLRHPVLPKVSDHFQEDENQYLVMEHIPGDDLSARLEVTNKPFPLSWVLFWSDQLLEALNYLHTNDPPIIHRDIKPQNLKLTDSNHIILLDFGLSKNSVENTRLSSTGSVVGYTPHYAPMEQIRGTGTNASSDIYSLAATLYQLLTNFVPSDALTRADALLSGLSDPLKPPHELNPEITPAISQVLMKALDISQDRRFQTAREMQKALRTAYATVQQEMTANTVAFNTNDKEIETNTKSVKPNTQGFNEPAQNQTASNAELPQSGMETVAMPHIDAAQMVEAAKAEAQNDSLVSSAKAHSKIDSVVRTDSPPSTSSEPLQSGVKTEVFIAGSTPAISEYQNNYANAGEQTNSTANSFTENFDAEDDFSGVSETPAQNDFNTADDFIEDENFAPGATVPLISFDKKEADTDFSLDDENYTDDIDEDMNFGSVPNRQESAAPAAVPYSGESFAPPRNLNSQTPAAANVQTSVPKAASPAAKKGSKGKIFAIIGGLSALLLLVIGAAGAGWYFYNSNTVVENDTPQATPSAVVEQSPEKTPDIMIADTDNSNTNAETNTNANTEEEPAEIPTQKPTPKPTRAAVNPTPVRTPAPIRTRTPKPKPAKTPRPQILP